MTNTTDIIKNIAIVAGILAIIAYVIYRYVTKREPSSPISYEEILNKAVAKVKASNLNDDSYELYILPTAKAKLFISQNPDYFDNISLKDLKHKEVIIWYIQSSNNVIYQEAIISESLAEDFTDIIPMDKVYRKIIKNNNQ